MGPRAPFGDLDLATLSPSLGRYFGAQSGVLVTRAPAGSGLEDGDVIVSVHGRVVTTADHARRILETYGPAEPAPVVVLRDHKTVELQLHAFDRKEMGDH
jgi:S1-C subfamily serine protease